MPFYLTNVGLWKCLWPILLIVVILASGIAFLAGKSGQRRELFFVVAAVSMLGIVTGYLAGFSRAPAIGTVLPAVLSLMGGLVIFLVGRNSESRVIVSVSILAFSLTLLIGGGWGAVMRDTAEQYKKSEIYLKQRAFIEAEVNEFRKNLDLPPLPVGNETKVH